MRPKGQRPCRCPLGCHSGHLSAREQRPPFQRLAPCAGRQHAEHPVLNAAQQQGFEALRQGAAPSANQQAALHSLWEKAPDYVPAHRGGWDEFPSAPAADAADGFRSGPSALGAAQDAGEAARRQAFLKWTQGEAMTAQEKAFVENLWNTDPAKASEYWAAGEFLDTEAPTSSALDGGGFDGTMKENLLSYHLNEEEKKIYRRPSHYRRHLREQVWQSAKVDGVVTDPLTNAFMDYDAPWEMGHKPGYEFRKHQRSAAIRRIGRAEFLNEYNNIHHYRPELPASNRSHILEDQTGRYLGP